MLGKFLEVSIPSDDVAESLSFYKLLGFQELETGDVWSHHYAVVSDGEITIGLHDREMKGPTLTFVLRDLARQARSMTDHGFDFEYMKLDDDVFNELGFHCRDGHMISIIEARTFSRPDEDADNSLFGRWLELSLPVRDTLRAGRFWAPLAPELLRMREEPTAHMRFNAAGLSLGLSESIALNGPSLCFCCDDSESVWIALAKARLQAQGIPRVRGRIHVDRRAGRNGDFPVQ